MVGRQSEQPGPGAAESLMGCRGARDQCPEVRMAPFGFPVVPEVAMTRGDIVGDLLVSPQRCRQQFGLAEVASRNRGGRARPGPPQRAATPS